MFFCSGIINLLFDGLAYNTSGHFAHCSYFSSPLRASENTTQLAKYPHVLYAKPSNKVYLLYNLRIKISRKSSTQHSMLPWHPYQQCIKWEGEKLQFDFSFFHSWVFNKIYRILCNNCVTRSAFPRKQRSPLLVLHNKSGLLQEKNTQVKWFDISLVFI